MILCWIFISWSNIEDIHLWSTSSHTRGESVVLYLGANANAMGPLCVISALSWENGHTYLEKPTYICRTSSPSNQNAVHRPPTPCISGRGIFPSRRGTRICCRSLLPIFLTVRELEVWVVGADIFYHMLYSLDLGRYVDIPQVTHIGTHLIT